MVEASIGLIPTWSTAVTVNTDTWVSWNAGATGGGLGYPQTAATNYTDAVWNSWIRVAQVGAEMAAIAAQVTVPTVPTPEQLRIEMARRELNRQRAVRRARRLLEEILSPEQREQLRMHGYFLVRQGEHTYRINRGRTHNILLLDANGHAIENLCIIPEDFDRIPEEDCMIAQKLLLEADHNAFRLTANISRYGEPLQMGVGRQPLTARSWLQVHRRARTRRAA